jgi:hypothetical protein
MAESNPLPVAHVTHIDSIVRDLKELVPPKGAIPGGISICGENGMQKLMKNSRFLPK